MFNLGDKVRIPKSAHPDEDGWRDGIITGKTQRLDAPTIYEVEADFDDGRYISGVAEDDIQKD